MEAVTDADGEDSSNGGGRLYFSMNRDGKNISLDMTDLVNDFVGNYKYGE